MRTWLLCFLASVGSTLAVLSNGNVSQAALVQEKGHDCDGTTCPDTSVSPYVGDMQWMRDYTLYSCSRGTIRVSSKYAQTGNFRHDCKEIPSYVIGVDQRDYLSVSQIRVGLDEQREEISKWQVGAFSVNSYTLHIRGNDMRMYVFGLNSVDKRQRCGNFFCGQKFSKGITAEKPTEIFFYTANDIFVIIRNKNGQLFPLSLQKASLPSQDWCFHEHLITYEYPKSPALALSHLRRVCGK